MATDLKEKTIKGIAWNLFEQFGLQGIRFILGVVMARLLTPADYGLVGVITVFFTVAQVFIDSGFSLAYIQKKSVSDKDANTVFYTNLLISLILYTVFWFGAPFIANFYKQAQLIELTRVMSLILIINSFNIIQIAQLTRAVDFKRRTKITLIATVTSGILGISCAYFGLGIWSLVVQQLSNRMFTTLGLWLTSNWSPKLEYSIQSLKELFSFGAWVLVSNIMRRLFDNINTLVIGKFFPIAQLGFYSKAKQLQEMVSLNLSNAVSTVSFPVFATIQHDKAQLQNAMNKFLTNTLIFLVPLITTFIVIAHPFIILLLTEKWAPMIPFFQLLCIAGFFYPIHLVNVQALTAQGKIKQSFIIEVIKNGLRILNIAIMYRWGVIFIIIGEVIVSLIALLINTYYNGKFVNYNLFSQFLDIKEILFGGLVAGISGVLICRELNNMWIRLFTGSFTVVGVFYLVQFFINRKLLLEVKSLKNYFLR